MKRTVIIERRNPMGWGHPQGYINPEISDATYPPGFPSEEAALAWLYGHESLLLPVPHHLATIYTPESRTK